MSALKPQEKKQKLDTPTPKEIPEELKCALTRKLLNLPVQASDGYVYEEEELKVWFSKGKKHSPVTGKDFPDQDYKQLHDLKAKIVAFLKESERTKDEKPTPLSSQPSSFPSIAESKTVDKTRPYALVYKAQLLLRSGNHLAAVRSLFQALQIDENNPFACLLLSRCYSEGIYLPLDRDKSIEFFNRYKTIAETRKEKLIPQDQGEKEYQAGLIAYYSPNSGLDHMAQSVEHFRQAAELGNAEARFNLALCYECAEGVKVNEKEATRWYEAADSKLFKETDEYSDGILGKLPSVTRPKKPDLLEITARDFRQKQQKRTDEDICALQINHQWGVIEADGNLKGISTEKLNPDKVMQSTPTLLNLAGKEAYIPSQLKMVELFEKYPLLFGQNVDLYSYRWLSIAAALGSHEGQYKLALLLKKGTTKVPGDLENAINYGYLAAMQGNKEAQYWLGSQYEGYPVTEIPLLPIVTLTESKQLTKHGIFKPQQQQLKEDKVTHALKSHSTESALNRLEKDKNFKTIIADFTAENWIDVLHVFDALAKFKDENHPVKLFLYKKIEASASSTSAVYISKA